MVFFNFIFYSRIVCIYFSVLLRMFDVRYIGWLVLLNKQLHRLSLVKAAN